MTQIFISHRVSGRAFVEHEVLNVMKLLEIEPWIAETEIRTAKDWEQSIRSALEASDWFMVVISANAMKSEWVKTELHWAMEHRQNRIIPLRIDDVPATEFHLALPRIQHVDFSQNERDGHEQLIKCLRDISDNPPRLSIAVTGEWHGDVRTHGDDNNEPTEYQVKASLSTKRERISGFITTEILREGNIVHAEYAVDGELFDARFFQLNYRSTNTAMIQFGSIVLEMNALGTKAHGKLAGFGPRRERLMTGDVVIEKDKSN